MLMSVVTLCRCVVSVSMYKCVCVPGKTVASVPVGGPAMVNNFMIAQPPGFQLATFVSATVRTNSVKLCLISVLPFIVSSLDCQHYHRWQQLGVISCVTELPNA